MNKLFNSCIFGSLSPAKKNICITIGTLGGIIVIPSLYVGINKLPSSPHITNYTFHKKHNDSQKRFPYGDFGGLIVGTFGIFPFSYLTYELVKNSKHICIGDTCCKIIRSRMVHSSLVTITSCVTISSLFLTILCFQSVKEYFNE